MKKTIAVALSAFFALTLLFWAVGCKKTETKNDLSNSESQQAIAAFKAKFNSDRITTTYVLNQKIKIPRNERSSLQGYTQQAWILSAAEGDSCEYPQVTYSGSHSAPLSSCSGGVLPN